ncbi:MAG TPA: TRAP transporter substrate-binding protein [Anaerovoracaceae bacterium]|nr:TRAP transporter substrate-binding protein [Anaerovoracaceae bacterium]
MKKLLILLLALAMCLATFTSCGSSSDDSDDSDDPIVIKIGHTDSSQRSTHTWSVWLGEYLEEQAPGRFEVEVYSDGQLGDSPDLVAGLGLNTVTMVFDLSSIFTTVAGPASSCIDLPYLYPSYEDWVAGTFENGGLELFNETIEDSDFYCIDMYYNGMRQVISRDKFYHSSDDLDGQKVRISQNDLNVSMWKAMGANPTPMAWGEVVTALSQGQVNALDHSLGVFNDFNFHEIAPYVTLTNHASSPFPVVCSKSWIESLDPADREVLEEGVHQMCAAQRDEERAKEADYLERFEAEGAAIEELSEEEVAAFIEAVQPVYDDMRAEIGDELMDKWLATVPE